MKLEDFDYTLPPELIAQQPLADRTASRMLHVDGAAGTWEDLRFLDLPGLIGPDDLLVTNDTRVIKARLYGRKASGGRVEALVERVIDDRHVLAQVRASHSPLPGSRLTFDPDLEAEVLGREDEFFRLRFLAEAPVHDLLERHGRLPLPPYIDRAAGAEDDSRYQTVFGRRPGAVAAPTAGLHFDTAMLDRIRATGADIVTLTLHVGAGTFQPVRTRDLSQHRMHAEWYEVTPAVVEAVATARARGGRVMAIGTTSLRALESAAASGALEAGAGETRLFVTPGYRFRVVDRLFTNFHLPKSTLLMLVAAFGGKALLHRAYEHAVDRRYRFFSYGDAMLIERAPEAAWAG